MNINVSHDRREAFDAEYAFVDSPYGEMIEVFSNDGLCYLGFAQPDRTTVLNHVAEIFPNIRLAGAGKCRDIFSCDVTLHLIGTHFQIDVWRALLDVGRGETICYSELARRAGHASAVRAVASAVGDNPVTLLVPCHRIVRRDGSIGQYYWGSELKRRMLCDEGAI
ncbi:MAG: methylated-DNA--[protein]-cysteine S-methyltransferase [Alistipes sp.]|nr:methylated-DNA--[protein]-cysteine S-methyltransferase [Alistipes sp.]